MKNWKTTLFGLIAAIPQLLLAYGVHVGHIGSGDFLSLLSALGIAGAGYYATDKPVPPTTPTSNYTK
jgi:hypothetical protein